MGFLRDTYTNLITSLLTVTDKNGFRIRHNGSAEQYLRIKSGSTQTAERTLTVVTGDANRTLDLTTASFYNPYYYVSNYASLTAAVAAIGATEGTLVIDADTTVTANLTIPATLSFVCLKGNLITHGAYTITINGNFEAGLFQVFNGTGAVTFGSGSIWASNPIWWGENTTPGTTDMTAKLQAAITAFGRVEIPDGTYKYTTKLTSPNARHIKGAGSSKTILQASSCIGIEYSPGSEAVAPFVIEGLTIDGLGNTSTTTGRGINIPGTATSSDIVYGLRIRDVKIYNINTAIHMRTARDIEVTGCGFYTFHGIKVAGQVVLGKFHHNDIIHDHSLGTGTAIGVEVNSASDYNPGGATELRPEDIQVHHNRIYGFDKGAVITTCLLTHFDVNDLDACEVIGFDVTTISGNGSIVENWINLGVAGGTHGILLQALGASQNCNIEIKGNAINATVNPTSAYGIEVRANQRPVIDGNTINLLTPTAGSDIIVGDVGATGTDVIITNNYLYSNVTNSISLINTSSTGIVKVDGNYLRGALYIHPTACQSHLDIGINTGPGANTYRTLIGSDAARLNMNIAEATGTPSGTTTYFDIAVAVPSGARLKGVQLRVDTALTTGETWGAAFITGSTTTIAAAGQAVAKNTKVNLIIPDESTTNTTNIRITRDAGNFTDAVGVIRAIVYYESLTAMADAA